MDIYSRRKRSQIMARVASQDTAPELAVRSLIHNMGFRFRLNRKDLSGKPDIVLPRLGKAIFVHGAAPGLGKVGCAPYSRDLPHGLKDFMVAFGTNIRIAQKPGGPRPTAGFGTTNSTPMWPVTSVLSESFGNWDGRP